MNQLEIPDIKAKNYSDGKRFFMEWMSTSS